MTKKSSEIQSILRRNNIDSEQALIELEDMMLDTEEELKKRYLTIRSVASVVLFTLVGLMLGGLIGICVYLSWENYSQEWMIRSLREDCAQDMLKIIKGN